MMSQVNFFMLPQDEREFVAMLFERGDTYVFSGRFFASRIPVPQESSGRLGRCRELTLVARGVMPRPRCSSEGEGAASGKYLFDSYRDPCAEFSRCRKWRSQLLAGRIYAHLGRLDGAEANRVHKAWYQAMQRWLKKRCRPHRGFWVAPHAERWSRAGGQLRFGSEYGEVLVESLGGG